MAKRNLNDISINADTLKGMPGIAKRSDLKPFKWYRIAQITTGIISASLINIITNQGNQVLNYMFSFNRSEYNAHLEQLGSGNRMGFNSLKIRIVRNGYDMYLEIYNNYKFPDAETYALNLCGIDFFNRIVVLSPFEVSETPDGSIIEEVTGREMKNTSETSINNMNNQLTDNQSFMGGATRKLIENLCVCHATLKKGELRDGKDEYIRLLQLYPNRCQNYIQRQYRYNVARLGLLFVRSRCYGNFSIRNKIRQDFICVKNYKQLPNSFSFLYASFKRHIQKNDTEWKNRRLGKVNIIERKERVA